MSNWRRSLAGILWFGMMLAGALGAAESSAEPQTSEPVTTTVTSERMTVRNKDRRAVFEGKVVLTKGDLVVRSDVMVVYYEPREGERAGSTRAVAGENREEPVAQMAVSRIEATGRVKIEKQAGTATCQKAVFYQREQKIVLTGEPVAWERGNRVAGDRMTMFLDQDRTVVEGGSTVMLEEAGGSGR